MGIVPVEIRRDQSSTSAASLSAVLRFSAVNLVMDRGQYRDEKQNGRGVFVSVSPNVSWRTDAVPKQEEEAYGEVPGEAAGEKI